ncbi:MAG: DUF1549 domain-containing protein, partial [Bryobacteraceae bacterium]
MPILTAVDVRRFLQRAHRLVSCALFLTAYSCAADLQYNRDVRPILSDRCYSCHGPDKGNRKAKLRLDIEADAKASLAGNRFAIVAGQPEASEAYKRIVSDSPVKRMPPAYAGHDRLKEGEVAILRQWIEQGAKYQPHWAFIPPQRTPLPPGIAKNPIDTFVLQRLQREGLKPSPEADKRTLLRRVSLDLTGLPPSAADLDSFLLDRSATAYERAVDKLLASPRYAERMAIRWLDAARYADTNGYQTDGPRTMWPWRDWVIDAFNRDMPYDQFTIEQIAGDLLPNATQSQRLATGFHRNHRTSAEGGIVDEEFRVEYVADRAETTATVWLGLTVGCARCHDHKFDPISQKDFYSLFAFFNNVPERGFVWNYGNEDPVMKAPSAEQQAKLDSYDSSIRSAGQNLDNLKRVIEKAQRKWERSLAKVPLDWTITEGRKLHVPSEQQFNGKDFKDAGSHEFKLNYRDPFTFAAWIQPQSLTGAILSKGEDYHEAQQHGLYLVEGKLRLHVTFRYTDLAMRVETEEPLGPNDWQHVAVTYDGGMRAAGVRMFVNGEPRKLKVLFDQLLWPIESKEPWRIGAGGGLRFNGSIRDVSVFDRALSPDEIAVLHDKDSLQSLAAISASKRAKSQADKLRLAFLELASPTEVRL